MSEYQFTEFTETGGRFKPIISLGEKTGFGLSSGFTHAYNMDGVIGVKLYYDESRSAVAFKFLKQKENGMVNVKLREKGGYIAAQAFLGRFKIDQKKYSGRYEPKEVHDDHLGKLYVIELKENNDKT